MDGEVKRVPGEQGVWVFVLADLLVFSVFFATFAWHRGRDLEVFRRSQESLNQTFGLVNTLLLLTGSLAVVLALYRARNGKPEATRTLLLTAIGTGLGFVLSKFFEYREKIVAGYTLLTNDFFMFYYMLTGIHLLHVAIGIGVLAFLLVNLPRAPRLFAPRDLSHLESGGAVWHLVDVLWIVLFPLLYLVK